VISKLAYRLTQRCRNKKYRICCFQTQFSSVSNGDAALLWKTISIDPNHIL